MTASLTNDWATGTLLAVLALNLFLSTLLLANRPNPAWDWRLAVLLIVLGFKGSPYVLGWRGHVEPPDWLTFFPLNISLAVGPLLYLYLVARATGRGPRRPWLHLTPPLIELAYCLLCLSLPEPLRHAWKETWHDHLVKPSFELAFSVSLFVYATLSLQLVRKMRGRLVGERSDADRFSAAPLQLTVLALLATAIGYGWIFIYSNWIAEIDVGPYFLWIAIVSTGLALEGWRATAIPDPRRKAVPADAQRKRHDWPALGARWRDRIEDAGWWREPELTLSSVARRLGVNDTYLSRAINDGLGLNFNELINGMRADEVARRIDAGETDELLSMAFDAGFSSKATFNRAFLDRHGISPRAHRQRLKV